MTNIITFYNHKGGVSKTTTTFNVAYLLAESGKKVLAVDADPQCNLTELMLAHLIDEYDEKQIDQLPGKSLLDILQPRISGEHPEALIEESDLTKITDNLFILRGDINLSTIEDALAEAHIQRFSTKVHEKRTYIALHSALRSIGQKMGIDVILLDVGPSSGALTRTCFLACDGFFVPTAPDRFNVQAITTLSLIVSRWISEHAQIIEQFQQLKLPIAEGKPAFLGCIIQGFKLYKGKPKKSFDYWMQKIPDQVKKHLIPIMKKWAISTTIKGSDLSASPVIANIPYFESLAPMMQATAKPVFSITQDDTVVMGEKWQGQVWTHAVERMKNYKSELNKITTNI